MRASNVIFACLSVCATAGLASAAPRVAGLPRPKLSEKQQGEVAREVGTTRLDRLRANARFFTKITVGRDWSGERVVHHDANVTAFLDMSDPQHPRYDVKNVDEDEGLAKVPAARRAHVLVIPNQPREHIAPSISGVITLDDVNATRLVLESAHQVARDLGIQNPRIYFNTADRLTVGYLHVHVVGETDGRPYPTLTP